MPSPNLFGTNSHAVSGSNVLKISTDGASRGNPGPASLGCVIGDKEYGEYLGIRTNNYAEYSAILFALKKARQLLGKEKAKKTLMEMQMDSELAVRQLNHQYKINDADIQRMFIEIWNMSIDFKAVTFEHIRREFNTRADAAANRALDEHAQK